MTEKILTALIGDNGTLRIAQYRDAWGKDSTSLQEYDYYLRAHALVTKLELEPVARAIVIATEGLSKFPQSALLKIELGIAYFIRGFNGWSNDLTADYQRAGTLVREAWAEPTLSPMERRLGYYLLAFVEMTEKKFDQALSDAEAAIGLSPYDIYMLVGLSQISVSAGKPGQALEWLDRAASLDANPQLAEELAFYRAWALAVEGRYEESLSALRESPQDETQTLLWQAIVLYRLGRTDEATAELKKALAMDPEFTQIKWRELWFYSDPTIVEREIADLAGLGLPEK